MNDDLYQTALLRLAAEATGTGRLQPADISVTVDNPLCGDRITLDLRLQDNHVTAIGHEVKACVICQASATLLGRYGLAKSIDELRAIAKTVADLLRQPESALPNGWEDLAALKPVAQIKSRHACATLPFRALTEALDQIKAD